MTTRTHDPFASALSLGVFLLLTTPVLVAFVIPQVGFVASVIALPYLALRLRPRLWPDLSRGIVGLSAGLAVVGLWLPAWLQLFTQGGVGVIGESTVWLVIPLCVPSTATALVVPALFATVASAAGLLVAGKLRHPWPWVLGAWVAPFAYEFGSRIAGGSALC